jgi:hypothetical protein
VKPAVYTITFKKFLPKEGGVHGFPGTGTGIPGAETSRSSPGWFSWYWDRQTWSRDLQEFSRMVFLVLGQANLEQRPPGWVFRYWDSYSWSRDGFSGTGAVNPGAEASRMGFHVCVPGAEATRMVFQVLGQVNLEQRPPGWFSRY